MGGLLILAGLVERYQVASILIGLVILGIALLCRLVIWPGKIRRAANAAAEAAIAEAATQRRIQAEWAAKYGKLQVTVISDKAYQPELKRLHKVQETPGKAIDDEITFGRYVVDDKTRYSVIVGTARIGDVSPEQTEAIAAIRNGSITHKALTINTGVDGTTGDVAYTGVVDIVYAR